MPYPKMVSPDGRRVVQVTSKDEGIALREEGYVQESKFNGEVETANSGAEGNRRARKASTTEGSETNSGSTTPADLVI